MGHRAKIFIALMLTGLIWLGVLLRLSLWHYTVTPADGYVSRTFEGWEEYPVSRHLFLAQLNKDDFGRGRPYVSVTYAFIFVNFLLLAPFHYLLGLPYNTAHNFLPYFYVFGLMLLIILVTRKQLLLISRRRRLLLWLLVFMSIGFTITDPLPWNSSYNSDRMNPHILAAAAFCYLSIWVFYDAIPKRPLLYVGVFQAFWCPVYVPAWILCSLFFRKTLKLDRKWILQVILVCALAAANIALPVMVSRWARVDPSGSTLLSRSGLDGSQLYVTSIFQAVSAPSDPRHWPTAWYFLVTAVVTLCFGYFFRDQKRHRPVQQAMFLLIPYCTTAVFLPQLTSIHPYLTDLLLFIPATFLMGFWSLQKRFWNKLNGRTYVAWLLVASLILMTNLLAVAQMPRFAFIEQKAIPVVSILVFGSLGLFLGVKLLVWMRGLQLRH